MAAGKGWVQRNRPTLCEEARAAREDPTTRLIRGQQMRPHSNAAHPRGVFQSPFACVHTSRGPALTECGNRISGFQNDRRFSVCFGEFSATPLAR